MQSQKILEDLLKDRKFANWTIPASPGNALFLHRSFPLVYLTSTFYHIAQILLTTLWYPETTK